MAPKKDGAPLSVFTPGTERGRKSFEQYRELYPSLPERVTAIVKSEIPFVRERITAMLGYLDKRSGEQPQWFSRRYKLTPTEAKIAAFLAERGSVSQFAKKHGKSEATVRTHLKAIFRKMGVSRQADLARIILHPRSIYNNSR